MGNLPFAVTTTLGSHDPISPALLNEIQQNIVAGARKPFTRVFAPKIVKVDATNAWQVDRLDAGPSFDRPAIKATAACEVYLELQFEEGETFLGGTLEAAGDGVADHQLQMDIVYVDPSSSVNIIARKALTNPSATFTTYALTAVGGGAITPQVIAPGSWMNIRLIASATTGGMSLRVGVLRFAFQRAP
jgi:hypothetical protein